MKLTHSDAAQYLASDAALAGYLSAVMAENDPELLVAARGDLARAKGMAKLAEDSGLCRESLYKALKPGAKPRFDTVYRIITALNLTLQATPAP